MDRAARELKRRSARANKPEMHFALARAYTRLGRKEDAAREREIFKRLQDQFEAQRNARRRWRSD